MSYVPSIIIGLDDLGQKVASDVLKILPADIRGMNYSITPQEIAKEERLAEAIARITSLTDTHRIKIFGKTIGEFFGNLIFIGKTLKKPQIESTIDKFQKILKNNAIKPDQLQLIIFSLFPESFLQNIPPNSSFFALSPILAGGCKLSEDEFYKRTHIILLLLLSSDLYSADDLEKRNFVIHELFSQDIEHIKSFGVIYHSLPYFEIGRYAKFMYEKKYADKLVEDDAIPSEKEKEIYNFFKGLVSLTGKDQFAVEERKFYPKLSFFSTKRTRERNIGYLLRLISSNLEEFQKNCNSEAGKARIALEKQSKEKLERIVPGIFKYLASFNGSIKLVLKIMQHARKADGSIAQLIKEKKNEIKWARPFLYHERPFKSNHPNWLITVILFLIDISPEIIQRVFPISTAEMLYWNAIWTILLGIYTIFSYWNIKSVNSSINQFYYSGVKTIREFFSQGIFSFIRFLEIHLLQRVIVFLGEFIPILEENIQAIKDLQAKLECSLGDLRSKINEKVLSLLDQKISPNISVDPLALNLFQRINLEEISKNLDQKGEAVGEKFLFQIFQILDTEEISISPALAINSLLENQPKMEYLTSGVNPELRARILFYPSLTKLDREKASLCNHCFETDMPGLFAILDLVRFKPYPKNDQ